MPLLIEVTVPPDAFSVSGESLAELRKQRIGFVSARQLLVCFLVHGSGAVRIQFQDWRLPAVFAQCYHHPPFFFFREGIPNNHQIEGTVNFAGRFDLQDILSGHNFISRFFQNGRTRFEKGFVHRHMKNFASLLRHGWPAGNIGSERPKRVAYPEAPAPAIGSAGVKGAAPVFDYGDGAEAVVLEFERRSNRSA